MNIKICGVYKLNKASCFTYTIFSDIFYPKVPANTFLTVISEHRIYNMVLVRFLWGNKILKRAFTADSTEFDILFKRIV
jgi:hypothetical protein